MTISEAADKYAMEKLEPPSRLDHQPDVYKLVTAFIAGAEWYRKEYTDVNR